LKPPPVLKASCPAAGLSHQEAIFPLVLQFVLAASQVLVRLVFVGPVAEMFFDLGFMLKIPAVQLVFDVVRKSASFFSRRVKRKSFLCSSSVLLVNVW
jgi:hypothetical protein